MQWLKRLTKRDVPRLKMEVGQGLYINGVRYVIVGMNLDMHGHIDIQTEVAHQYTVSRMVGQGYNWTG